MHRNVPRDYNIGKYGEGIEPNKNIDVSGTNMHIHTPNE